MTSKMPYTDSDTDRRIQKLARRMRLVSRVHRAKHPLKPAPWRIGHFLLPVWSNGRPAHKALMWYHNQGCAWAREAGCTMCNFGEREEKFIDDKVVGDFKVELQKLDPGTRIIHLGPGGSFLRDYEVNSKLRSRLVKSLEVFPFLESVGLETRAETIIKGRIKGLIKALPKSVRELALGFGLESANELILRVAINKNQHIRDLERAIESVHEVNESDRKKRVIVDCYVLLKPPFITEAEAIQDAISSINWAYDRGVDTVSLFVNTVKKNTICAYLAHKSGLKRPLKYEPPYLLSVFEVLKGLTPDYRRRTNILGFTSGNPYSGAPRACKLCWHVLYGLISAHNYTRDPALLNISQELRCECREKWLRETSRPSPGDLYGRFDQYVGWLEKEFPTVST